MEHITNHLQEYHFVTNANAEYFGTHLYKPMPGYLFSVYASINVHEIDRLYLNLIDLTLKLEEVKSEDIASGIGRIDNGKIFVISSIVLSYATNDNNQSLSREAQAAAEWYLQYLSNNKP